MRLLALALATLAPVAAADQSLSAGPASVLTQNASWGDGDCDPAASGGQARYARASVEITPRDELVLQAGQSCSTWTDGTFSDDAQSGFVHVGRSADQNAGPYAQLNWLDWRYGADGYEDRTCYTQVYASGLVLSLGCLPAGERWPTMPALP